MYVAVTYNACYVDQHLSYSVLNYYKLQVAFWTQLAPFLAPDVVELSYIAT